MTKCEDGYFKKGLSMEGMQTDYVCHPCNLRCATCKGDFIILICSLAIAADSSSVEVLIVKGLSVRVGFIVIQLLLF